MTLMPVPGDQDNNDPSAIYRAALYAPDGHCGGANGLHRTAAEAERDAQSANWFGMAGWRWLITKKGEPIPSELDPMYVSARCLECDGQTTNQFDRGVLCLTCEEERHQDSLTAVSEEDEA